MLVSSTTSLMRAWVAPLFSLLLVTGYTVAQSDTVASEAKHSHPAQAHRLSDLLRSTRVFTRGQSRKPTPIIAFCNPKT